MTGVTKRSFGDPDVTRTPERMRVSMVDLGAAKAVRMAMQPGWRWSEHVGPAFGIPSCQVRHVGVVAQGRLHVRHDDGTEVELSPGEAYVIEPGHDAWVVGDERFLSFEFDDPTTDRFAAPAARIGEAVQ